VPRTFSELHCPTRMGTMGPKSTVLTVALISRRKSARQLSAA
jgi:hypothetical protein